MGQRSSSANRSHAIPEGQPSIAGASGSTSPSDEPLWWAAVRVPVLLQWQCWEEANALLARALEHLEKHGLKVSDATYLQDALVPALKSLPQLAVLAPHFQTTLGFTASGLAASVAAKAVAGEASLLRQYRDLLQKIVTLVAAAWHSRSLLVHQPIDNNRFVLRLCEVLMERGPSGSRAELVVLAAHCSSTPAAQMWTARFFQSNLQGVLLAFSKLSPLKDVAADRFVFFLLQQCHTDLRVEMLERVLLFLEAWDKAYPRDSSSTLRWLSSARGLPATSGGNALTPVACIVAFFLARAIPDIRGPLGEPHGPLSEWLRVGVVRSPSKKHEDLVIQGYVCSVAFKALEQEQGRDWWTGCARVLQGLMCNALLPSWLLDCTDHQLQSHQRSPVLRLLPSVAASLAEILANLDADAQASLVMQPFEVLGLEWSERWDGLSEAARYESTRSWFGSTVMLFVSTLARQAKLDALSPMCLLRLVRTMAYVDLFRQDTVEFHALCLRIVECGAPGIGFVEALLWTFVDFCSPLMQDGARATLQFTSASRIYFLLGILASPEVIRNEAFFPAVWPVVISCVGDCVREGKHELVQIALRAHALASVALEEVGTDGRWNLVSDCLSASVDAFQGRPKEDLCRALLHTVEVVAKDLARRCAEEVVALPDVRHPEDGMSRRDSGESRQQQCWLLGMLGKEVLRNMEERQNEAAEGLFKVLCGAACHADPTLWPEPLSTDCHLSAILATQQSMRDIWLQHLIISFPEGAREVMTLRLLEDFPGTAAAFSEGAADQRSGGKGWLRSML